MNMTYLVIDQEAPELSSRLRTVADAGDEEIIERGIKRPVESEVLLFCSIC